MKKVEFRVLKRDIDLVLERLGRLGLMQIDFAAAPAAEPVAEGPSLGESLESACAYLGLDCAPGVSSDECGLPGESDRAYAAEIIGKTLELRRGIENAAKRLEGLAQALAELRAFMKMGLPLAELELLTFIHLQTGRIDLAKLPWLTAELGERAIVVPLGDDGRIAAVSSKKGRFALDGALKQAGFVPQPLPADLKGLPSDVIASLESEEAALLAAKADMEGQREALAAENDQRLACLMQGFRMAARIEEAKRGLFSTDQVYLIQGWVPRDRLKEMAEQLEAVTEGRLAARSFDPEEVPAVAEGRVKVPVALKHGVFLSGFERLVASYGTPLYGTIDPTPFVAVWFVLFFSIMFGDMGQALVILAAGLAIRLAKRGKLAGLKPYYPILLAVGAGAFCMGFLENSFFADEELFVPVYRALTKALLGREMDRFLSLTPRAGIGKLLPFFVFTLALGVLVNSAGILINLVNLARKGKRGEFLFSKTGLAGALFFWYSLYLGVRTILGWMPGVWDIAPLGLPLLALLLAGPLERLVNGHRPLMPDGFFSSAIQGVVEVLESISYYVSNTVSFLRVGAFSVSHAVLSFVVYAMAEMVSRGAPLLSGLGRFLVFLVGNAVIIALEGMVVAIQVIRLQYYEFFSKFFTETGVEFRPFSFMETKRSSRGKGD
jgi:V/A-type H+-transporting ATPase subunit I